MDYEMNSTFDRNLYLRETAFLDFSDSRLRAQARKLTANLEKPADQARALFFFVRDQITYNPYTSFKRPEDYRASVIMARGAGFCIPKASLFAALLRSCDIPAKFYFADIINHKAPPKIAEIMGNFFAYHCYCGVFLENRWVKAAPTFNRELFLRIEVEPNDFDGRHDALLPGTDRFGHPFVEYVKDRGEDHDIPFAQIMTTFSRIYGPETMEKWQASSSPACR
ncbi:MAG TPA: transglutaminase family protein [Proteobacteria bacterium]|nr:transglutaminase family protein [Pseudomonadota bacterium]